VVPALPDQRTPCWPSALPLARLRRAEPMYATPLCEGVVLQTQPDQGEANVHKRSWNGDGKETNGHSGACSARPANTMLAQRTPPRLVGQSNL
jgi:hypothetical protein